MIQLFQLMFMQKEQPIRHQRWLLCRLHILLPAVWSRGLTAHRTVVSGASWIRPYVAEECRRDVKHYVDAVNRMKSLLGCTDDSRRRIL